MGSRVFVGLSEIQMFPGGVLTVNDKKRERLAISNPKFPSIINNTKSTTFPTSIILHSELLHSMNVIRLCFPATSVPPNETAEGRRLADDGYDDWRREVVWGSVHKRNVKPCLVFLSGASPETISVVSRGGCKCLSRRRLYTVQN